MASKYLCIYNTLILELQVYLAHRLVRQSFKSIGSWVETIDIIMLFIFLPSPDWLVHAALCNPIRGGLQATDCRVDLAS